MYQGKAIERPLGYRCKKQVGIIMNNSPGKIITFYSYKGGVGRSMILANVAWILASNGKRVLVVDWDLEAPGLHRYFHPFLLEKDLTSTKGLLEFLTDFVDGAITPMDNAEDDPNWYEPFTNILRYAESLEWKFLGDGTIDFVPAGRQGQSYSTKVNLFNWYDFYERLGGGIFLDSVRKKMCAEYDYVLIDSRTGVSDTSGICTVQMPDTLVVFFTANDQSLLGAEGVAASVYNQWQSVESSSEKKKRVIFPVLTRADHSEMDKLDLARHLAKAKFAPFLDHISDTDEYWGNVEIPYISWYAYEEVLATFRDESGQRVSLLAAVEQLVTYMTEGEIRKLIPSSMEDREKILSKFTRHPSQKTYPALLKHHIVVSEKEEQDSNIVWYNHIKKEFHKYLSSKEESEQTEKIIEFLNDLYESFPVKNEYERLKGYVSILTSATLGSLREAGNEQFYNLLKENISVLQEKQLSDVFKPLIEQIIERELDEYGRFVELLREKLVSLSNPNNEEAKRQFRDIVESIVQKGTQQVKEVAVATTKLGVTHMSDSEIEETFGRMENIFKPVRGIQEGFDKIWQAFRITKQGLSDESEKFFDGLTFSIYACQVFPPISEYEDSIHIVSIVNISENYVELYNQYIENKIVELYDDYIKAKDNYPKLFNEIYEYEPVLIGWLQKDEYGNWRDTDEFLIQEAKHMDILEDKNDDKIRVNKIDDFPKFCILFSTRENGWSVMIVTSEPASKRFREEIGLIIDPGKKRQKVAIEDIYNKLYFLTKYYQMPKIEIALFNKELNLPLSETQILATRAGETVLPGKVEYISYKCVDKTGKVYTDRKGKVKKLRHIEIHDTNKIIRNILMRIRKDESPDMIHFSYENFWYVWASKKQNRYLILKLEKELNIDRIMEFQSDIANVLKKENTEEHISRIRKMIQILEINCKKNERERTEEIIGMSLSDFNKNLSKNYSFDNEVLIKLLENNELTNLIGKYCNTLSVKDDKEVRIMEDVFVENITTKIWSRLVKAEKHSDQRKWVDVFVRKDASISPDTGGFRKILKFVNLISKTFIYSWIILLCLLGTLFLFPFSDTFTSIYDIEKFFKNTHNKIDNINNQIGSLTMMNAEDETQIKKIMKMNTDNRINIDQLIDKIRLMNFYKLELINAFDTFIEFFNKNSMYIPDDLEQESQERLRKILLTHF